jgi:hypothetical protein
VSEPPVAAPGGYDLHKPHRRRTLIAMLAHDLLAAIAAAARATSHDQPSVAGLIPLSCNQIA